MPRPKRSNRPAGVKESTPAAQSEASIDAAIRIEDSLWRDLEKLSDWVRLHMPVLGMPHGPEVVIWLLSRATQALPLKDLYGSSRFSEPTIRALLRALADGGYIVIERNPRDLRMRTVQSTAKLVTRVQQYLELLRGSRPSTK